MYTEYFGFREDPFNTSTDIHFYYSNPVFQGAYDSLLYGIRQRKGFMLLTGEVGTGKTTLLRWLMRSIEDSVRFVYFFNTKLNFEEMLSMVCDDLALPVKGIGRLRQIQAINEFLYAQSEAGGTGVFLIDEAQNLDDEFLEPLRLLANLEKNGQTLLQVILVGQPELERKIAQPRLRQLNQRIAIRCRLERLYDREMEAFITLRLQTAGYTGPRLFSAPALRKIGRYSQGIPRLVNVICDNALLIAYNLSQKEVSEEIIDEVAQDFSLDTDAAQDGPEEQEENEEHKEQGWNGGIAEAASTEMKPDAPQSPDFPLISVTERQSIWKNRLRSPFGLGVAALLIFVLLGGARALFSPDQVQERVEADRSVPQAVSVSERTADVPAVYARSALTPGDESALTPGDGSEQQTSDDLLTEATPSRITQEQEKGENSLRQVAGQVKDSGTLGQQNQLGVVPPGSTIWEMVTAVYGSSNTLALDLVNQSNPHISNLNSIRVGEKIWFPPLLKETLVRQQPDHSFHLAVRAFRKQTDARQFAQSVREQDYLTVVTTYKMTDDLTISRVEIEGLADQDAVERAWSLVNIEPTF